jgi:hypothetical protein
MWWVLVGLMVVFWLMSRREGMSLSPSDMVQLQVGKIQQMREQIAALTLSPDVVTALNNAVTTTFTDTSTLQANIGQTPNAY